jgi:hypothetical protein
MLTGAIAQGYTAKPIKLGACFLFLFRLQRFALHYWQVVVALCDGSVLIQECWIVTMLIYG